MEIDKLIINILENRGWICDHQYHASNKHKIDFINQGYVLTITIKDTTIMTFGFGINNLSIDLCNKNSVEELQSFVTDINRMVERYVSKFKR